MSWTLMVRPEAEAGLTEAYGWYEERGKGLGVEFLNVVETERSIHPCEEMYPCYSRASE